MSAMKDFGCNMSLKVHDLHGHLDCFIENLGDVSEEQDERFHQHIKVMENVTKADWTAV